MNKIENYLHEFLLVFFVNVRLVKRVFLGFALVVILLPLALKQSFEVTAQVIVQSKKLSQTDANTALTPDSDKFIPPSLADLETEANILRSPSLIRQTIEQLRDEGNYQVKPSVLARLVTNPLKANITDPLRSHLVNPVRAMLGLEVDPPRDTSLDSYTDQAVRDLKIGALPGSNVISINYRSRDPALGTQFVARLLSNYLKDRQDLQSNELPESFYEQKKAQYQQRLNDLEFKRQTLLEAAHASDPKEEITFRLNAINTEEQSLNDSRDSALESRRVLDYLRSNLVNARKAGLTDTTFPYAFANTVDNVAYEDREIKQLGGQLTSEVSDYGNTAETFRNDSEPMRQKREQIVRTRDQFLKVVDNRIRERASSLDNTNAVIAQKTARIADYKARIRDLQEVQSKLRQLDTEIDALHIAFGTYTQRYEESRGERLINGELSNARVLSQPYEPSEAASPKPMQIIPLGLLTGLLLAIALGYVREFFDHRFKHPGQLSDHLKLTVLMVINDVQAKQANPYKRWTWQWLWHWVRQ